MKKIKVDSLGRIVIPIWLRRELGITSNSTIELSFDGEKIILSRESAYCKLCGISIDPLNKIPLCKKCFNTIKEM